MRLFALAAAFVAFTGYTLYVMAGHGVLGFLTLAGREPWALQLLVDLGVMMVLFATWAAHDAKARGWPVWPTVVTIVVMGSMGALGYLVVREVVDARRKAAPR